MKKIISISVAFILLASTLTSCNMFSDEDFVFDSQREISVVSRESGSGTRTAFTDLFGITVKDDTGTHDTTTEESVVVNSTDVMIKNMLTYPYSIGYVSLGSLSDNVKPVKIDGVSASEENIINDTYKIYRPFIIATKGEVPPLASDFINFILSTEGQNIVSEIYVSVPSTEGYTSTKPEGKLVISGSSSVSPIMEKLIEGYNEINPNAIIELQMSDSSSGITAAIDGTCDIAMASRELKEKELAELNPTVIALDGIVVIVNHLTPIDNLTSEQVRQIYTGEVTTWDQVLPQ